VGDATRDDDAAPSGFAVGGTVDDPPRGRAWSAATVDVVPGRMGSPPPIPPPEVVSIPARSPFDPAGDRFEPRGELGRGGMGRVEDAFDRALERPVAIKHLLGGSARDLVRFAREARITARLEHPGIVPVHEAGRGDDGTPYYVMRRIDGRPLSDAVIAAALRDRLALIPHVLAACDAVGFAHARGVVHRDLKPNNILVGPFGETLVIDWGLAREIALVAPIEPDGPNGGDGGDGGAAAASGAALAIAADDLTAAGAVAGTPGFMPPEQARGEDVDARADVFALGATLFYVLTGELLYGPVQPTEMLATASAGGAPNWRALPARVPPELRAILDKALASDPAHRYRDAGALAADLRQFVTGNLVGAYEYSALARLARFARRHRAAIAIAAASTLLLAATAIVSVRRIVAERDDARRAREVAEVRQREARDAADDLVVQRAQELAATDPVGAIALLRRLDPASSRWRDAWLAATVAAARGIPIGFRGIAGNQWLQIAADNRRVISAGDGGIAVYDLVARTRRIVATPSPPARMCQWIGKIHVLCIDMATHASIVDAEYGTARPLDLALVTATSDRQSRALAETADHRIVEITGPEGASRVIATDAELAGVSPDLERAALWHGDALELWTASGVVALARFRDPAVRKQSPEVQLRGDAIATIVGDRVLRWHLEAGRVVEESWPRTPYDLEVLLAGSQVHTFGGRGLRRLDGGQVDPYAHPGWVFATARGLVAFDHDGAVRLLDADGEFRFGPHPAEFRRADLSLDGRWLAAITDRGEVIAWEVGAFRPRATQLSGLEQPVLLEPGHVWTRHLSDGLVRHELYTDTRKVALALPPLDAHFVIADDGRWAAAPDPASGKLWVYDATSGRRGPMDRAAAEATTADGLAIVRDDAVIGRWHPGDSAVKEEIGKLPAPPRAFSIRDRVVVAMFVPGKLARFELATGQRRDADFADGVREVELASGGRAWIATSHGELWRWDGEGAPARVAPPDPVARLWSTHGHVLARGAHSLISLDGDAPHAVPLDAREVSWMGADYAAALLAHGVVAIVDLQSGRSLALPAPAVTDHLIARDGAVMYATDHVDDRDRYVTLELRVPHDPAALQRWLTDVTNARQPDGGHAAEWP
jgi:hypothetical protein